MSRSTSRLGLLLVDGTDEVSAFPNGFNSNSSDILDNAAIYEQGPLASRPTSSLTAGTLWKTTDSGKETLAWTDGSLWLPLGLIPQTTTVSASVLSGQCLITGGAGPLTVTLPSHAQGQIVAVMNQSGGGTTVSGSAISGLGLSGASSFPLGAFGATATLIDDGTNWRIIAGQQDSGWVAVTPAASIASGGYGAAARLQGDRVWLRGTLTNNTGSTDTGTIATITSGLRPSQTINLIGTSPGSQAVDVQITSGGAISVPGPYGFLQNSFSLSLDNLSYSLS